MPVRAHVSHAHRPFASCKKGLLLFYYGTGLCQYIAIANEGEVEYSCVNGAMDLGSSCGKILRMKLIHGIGRFIVRTIECNWTVYKLYSVWKKKWKWYLSFLPVFFFFSNIISSFSTLFPQTYYNKNIIYREKFIETCIDQ